MASFFNLKTNIQFEIKTVHQALASLRSERSKLHHNFTQVCLRKCSHQRVSHARSLLASVQVEHEYEVGFVGSESKNSQSGNSTRLFQPGMTFRLDESSFLTPERSRLHLNQSNFLDWILDPVPVLPLIV